MFEADSDFSSLLCRWFDCQWTFGYGPVPDYCGRCGNVFIPSQHAWEECRERKAAINQLRTLASERRR